MSWYSSTRMWSNSSEIAGPGGRVAAERVPEQEQVVVVERALRALALGVALEDRADRLALLRAPRVLALEHLGELGAAVHGARVDVGERVLAREPPLALAEPQLAADQVHQVGRVGPVQDREAGGQAERPAVEPEQPVGGRVERAAPDPAERAVAGQLLGAREHLAGGAARERQQQDPLGRDAAIDQVRDPAGERPGLARAGPGDHQQRPAEVLDGRSLLRVEALHRVEHAFEQDRVAVGRGQGPRWASGKGRPLLSGSTMYCARGLAASPGSCRTMAGRSGRTADATNDYEGSRRVMDADVIIVGAGRSA